MQDVCRTSILSRRCSADTRTEGEILTLQGLCLGLRALLLNADRPGAGRGRRRAGAARRRPA